jgi:integrase
MSRLPGKQTDTEPLSEFEYKMILAHMAAHWRLFFELLWETGLRVSEALAITRADLVDNGVWITREKRADHRRDHLPISPGLYSRLKIEANHNGRLFPYTSAAAWLACRNAGKAVNRNIHPHNFRHSFGYRAVNTDFKDKTPLAHMKRVQEMMGHVSAASTQVYTNATKEDVRDGFRTMNGG